MSQVAVCVGDRQLALPELSVPLALDGLLPGDGEWEVEIGFGKGRYLIRCAQEAPDRRFLGIEVAASYHRLAAARSLRRGLTNLALIRGEALYVLAAVLPVGFASAVHVYFPDPWPKTRHQKRRLFDPETVDLVLGLLRPGGRLFFATDFLEYGRTVQRILESHPSTRVHPLSCLWSDGPRTNYEIKYAREGRPILRLEVGWQSTTATALHPVGRTAILAATGPKQADLEPLG